MRCVPLPPPPCGGCINDDVDLLSSYELALIYYVDDFVIEFVFPVLVELADVNAELVIIVLIVG